MQGPTCIEYLQNLEGKKNNKSGTTYYLIFSGIIVHCLSQEMLIIAVIAQIPAEVFGII